MEDDKDIVSSLEDAGWDALDQQGLNNGEFYCDPVSGYVEGPIDVKAFILAVLEAYWEEYGR